MRRLPLFVGYAILMAVVAFGFARVERQQAQLKRQQAQLTDQQEQIEFQSRLATYRTCVQGNTARKAIADAIRAQAETLVTSSEHSGPQPKTPTEKAQRADALRFYRAETERRLAPLAPRDCGTEPQRRGG